MKRTEGEIKAYIENLLPDFKQHKREIIKAYGEKRYTESLTGRVKAITKDWNTMQQTIPDINVEEIVIYHNDTIADRMAHLGGVQMDELDWMYNQQLNIIAGMIIRGYDV